MIDTLFYHAPCPDGFGAAWALRQKYKNATYVPLAYGQQLDPSLYQGKNVLMVDVVLDEESMDTIYKESRSFRALDHHKTALKFLANKPYVFLDMKKAVPDLLGMKSFKPFLK